MLFFYNSRINLKIHLKDNNMYIYNLFILILKKGFNGNTPTILHCQ